MISLLVLTLCGTASVTLQAYMVLEATKPSPQQWWYLYPIQSFSGCYTHHELTWRKMRH